MKNNIYEDSNNRSYIFQDNTIISYDINHGELFIDNDKTNVHTLLNINDIKYIVNYIPDNIDNNTNIAICITSPIIDLGRVINKNNDIINIKIIDQYFTIATNIIKNLIR